jgi:OFA family oxalate/formate antiporter-like MFS transporter
MEKNYSSGLRALVMVAGCAMGLMAGLIYTWSIWVQPICEEYGWETDQVALMGNVMLATFVLGVTIGGQLLPKIGARKSCFIGSILFGGFFLISAYVTSPVLMYITYGGFAGIGVGILYVVCQFTVSAWFPNNRGLMMGIFLTIFGLSVTIFSAPINMMLSSYGVRKTMTILAIIILVICLPGSAIFRDPPADGTGGKGSADSSVRSLTPGEAVKTRTFWQITIAYALLVWPYAFISSYFGVFLADKGFDAAIIVTAVSATGVGSALGRFVGGFLVDKLGSKLTYFIMCLCSVIACVGMMLTENASVMIAMIVILCLGYGGRTPVYGVIFTKEFGPGYSSGIYGYATLGTAIFLVVAPLTTAAIHSASGSFSATFILAIIITVIGCASLLLIPKESPVEKAQKE